MKPTIRAKLEHIAERYQEVGALLSDAGTIADQNRFRQLSREYAEIEPIAQSFQRYQQVLENIQEAEALLQDPDPQMRALGEDERVAGESRQAELELEMQRLLLPKDPNDQCSAFLEIRAGTGGDEAAIFAGDLFRMYSRYAELRRWKIEVLSQSEGEHGGYKEIITHVSGPQVYGTLKFESGAHRVQRVPATESQGRIHTSACTVAIMPEVEAVEAVELNKADLKVDTYRASGAGGQHINKTESAIRITHIPTGMVVECQEERSQHKNRAKAMALLYARIMNREQEQAAKTRAETRKSLVGSGDRSERIRTYNFPQGRVTDHRINLTLYKLDDIMQGQLDDLLTPLEQEHQTELLAELSQA